MKPETLATLFDSITEKQWKLIGELTEYGHPMDFYDKMKVFKEMFRPRAPLVNTKNITFKNPWWEGTIDSFDPK